MILDFIIFPLFTIIGILYMFVNHKISIFSQRYNTSYYNRCTNYSIIVFTLVIIISILFSMYVDNVLATITFISLFIFGRYIIYRSAGKMSEIKGTLVMISRYKDSISYEVDLGNIPLSREIKYNKIVNKLRLLNKLENLIIWVSIITLVTTILYLYI